MKYFVFSDVHGYYSILKKTLKKAGFDEKNENHMLISIGDNFDRGPENYKMFLFLKRMKKKNKIILIRGNHEDLFVDMMLRNQIIDIDIHNGTYDTLNEFYKLLLKENGMNAPKYGFHEIYQKLKSKGFFKLIFEMEDYYETENYIFTHGFIPVNMDGPKSYYSSNFEYNPNWRDLTKYDFKDSRWLNGIMMSMKFNISEPNKKIVVGHYHSSYGNVRKDMGPGFTEKEYRYNEFSKKEYFKPYEDENIIAIDAYTHYSKIINVLVIED